MAKIQNMDQYRDVKRELERSRESRVITENPENLKALLKDIAGMNVEYEQVEEISDENEMIPIKATYDFRLAGTVHDQRKINLQIILKKIKERNFDVVKTKDPKGTQASLKVMGMETYYEPYIITNIETEQDEILPNEYVFIKVGTPSPERTDEW